MGQAPAPPSPAIAPFYRRGFTNAGNQCYCNAVLQALLSSSAFLGVCRELAAADGAEAAGGPAAAAARRRDRPAVAALAALGRLCPPLGVGAGAVHAASPREAVDASALFAAPLAAFEATRGCAAPAPAQPPATAAAAVRAGLRKPVAPAAARVRPQQDAQEWLSFLLETAHSELVASPAPGGGGGVEAGDAAAASAAAASADGGDWEAVVPGRRGRTVVARSHATLGQESAVSLALGGAQASEVRAAGAKPSRTSEPFLVLSLTVGPRSRTVLDALLDYCRPEALEAYRGESGAACAAARSLRVERPPRTLLLHLKLFAYSAAAAPEPAPAPGGGGGGGGGSVKLVRRRVGAPERLVLPRGVCDAAPPAAYALAGLVEHVGEHTRCGHYVAYARHGGGWLRLDDAACDPVAARHVAAVTPYLAVYERCE